MREELSWAQIGERVRESRAAAGLSQHLLAERVGLERSMVSKLENGERRIDAVELTRLARALDYPLSHFLHPAPEVVSRRAAIADGGDIGESRAARDAYRTEALLSEWLRDVRRLIGFGVLEPRRMLLYPEQVRGAQEARRSALWLRDRLDLGTEPIESVSAVCEQAGQFTAIVPLPSDGASLVDADVAVAVVNKEQAPGRRRSTAAHELGHMVLGDEFSSDLGVHASREDREKAVEAFAAEFLLPTSEMGSAVEQDGEKSRRRELARLSATYRVSWGLAVTQLRRTGEVEPEEVRRLRTRTPTDVEFKDALGWKPQPDLDSIRVPPGYASAVVMAMETDKITPHRAVEMLRGQVSLAALTEEATD
ncbi:XRE family transcriptional regulator [Nocardiopsis tropica]|uniref:XRE family transcriptional regulator n=1 Tax=Nocardiopsis tropica TaxID=109330 RepID=A0ABU7KHZ3_9ACTN|nr:XRE family transcriptional regulator [Nocardiopsis umidischolae]MEE2048916.1 XRE family transcriptional regulator [Nocardiopsis umidischolae]